MTNFTLTKSGVDRWKLEATADDGLVQAVYLTGTVVRPSGKVVDKSKQLLEVQLNLMRKGSHDK